MDLDARLDRFNSGGLGFGYRRSDIRQTDIVLSANLKLKREDREVVSSRTEAFFKEKKQKQPITERSAGCVFKNSKDSSAGRIIDEAGCKGMRIGDVEVSSVHANFFVNRGNGSASDFMNLMADVSSIVHNKFGIALEPEIRVVGKN
jgi:UDP-N-acetylmuramate dehydrogenase